MAHKKSDLVQETSTSTGVGNMALGGAVTRRRAFSSVMADTDTAYVLIENASAAEWEVCLATYVSAGNQLSRGAVLSSSTGSAVSFSAGTKTISLIAPAAKAIVEDNNGDASITRRLGVGFATPGYEGDFRAAANTTVHVMGNTSGVRATVSVDTPVVGAAYVGSVSGAPFVFGISNAELMRLNATGLGIGRTPNAKLDVAGSVVVSDGAYSYTGFNGVTWTGAIRSGIQYDGTSQFVSFYTAGTWRGGVDASGNWRPGSDNTVTSGSASFRWSVVYAGTGTINTSGRDAKVGIRSAIDAERRAARRILDGGPKLYRLKDAFDAKGDAARIHAGYIAEDVRDALEAEGLDPWAYGFMCADEIFATEEYTVEVERPKVRAVQVAESAVELIDGRPVMVTRTVQRDEPVGQLVPVVDGNGDPVLVPGGEPDAEGDVPLVPMLHFVPEIETVTETRTREVPTGEQRLGLRYSELEAFLRCAD